MNGSAEREQRLVRYLLGRLPATERVEVEARLFDDAALDEQLLQTTDELIHAYLAGELPEEDRGAFESHFLTAPEHRERLAVVRDLMTLAGRGQIAQSGPRAVPALAWLAAAAALALVALGAWALFLRGPAPPVPQNAGGPPPGHPLPGTPAESPALPAVVPAVPPPQLSAALSPDGAHRVSLPRTTGAPVAVALPAGTRVVRLQLSVAKASPSFDAVLRRADGEEVWRAEGVAPGRAGEPLVLEVPAERVAAGDYALRVEGESLREGPPFVREYRLRVRRGR